MITKVQGKTVSGELSVKACPRLNGLEKAMLKWAVVDPEDRVLDAALWMVLSRRASITYCLREYSK